MVFLLVRFQCPLPFPLRLSWYPLFCGFCSIIFVYPVLSSGSVFLETLDGVATIVFFHLHVYASPFPLLYGRVVKAVGLSWCFGCESLGGRLTWKSCVWLAIVLAYFFLLINVGSYLFVFCSSLLLCSFSRLSCSLPFSIYDEALASDTVFLFSLFSTFPLPPSLPLSSPIFLFSLCTFV